jgi:hypothetical protein
MQLNIFRNSFFSSALLMFFVAVAPQSWAGAGPSTISPNIASVDDPALTTQVATPVISPATGPIASAQSITITDATEGATIYYATFGPAGTGAYVPYTVPIPMEGSGELTIQAYATASGDQQSNIASATYLIG